MTSAVGLAMLLVDDDELFRERLARAFRDRGLEVATAHDFTSAVAMASDDPPELAVVDLKMPGPSGLDVVRELKDIDPAIRILVLTGYSSVPTAVEAMKLGAVHYLAKPADADEILAALGLGENVSATTEVTTPTLARMEWDYIQRVLADSGNSISEAARRLGLPRRTLQRKLSKHPP